MTREQQRAVAHASWEEAMLVAEAYAEQVRRARERWRAARTELDTARARRALRRALDQHAAACQREQETYRVLHSLTVA